MESRSEEVPEIKPSICFGDIKATKPQASNSFHRNVELLAAHHDNITESGHGFFFDFSKTPEYEKPVLDLLISQYGWTLEKPFFIRKPEVYNIAP